MPVAVGGTDRLPYTSARTKTFEEVVADAHGVGDRGKRRIDRADAREEARVDDVQVVQVVRLAVRVEHRRLRVIAEADGAAVVGYAGDRDLLVEHREARDRPLLAADRSQQPLQLSEQALVRLAVVVRLRQMDAPLPIDRDPVPRRYSEQVRRYYERLGSGK